MNLKAMKDPFALITILITVSILVNVVINIFPTLISDLVSLGSLGNFTFASFFESAGLMSLIISAVILITVLAVFGIKMKSSKR